MSMATGTDTSLIEALRAIPVFEGLSEEQLAWFASNSQDLHYETGDVIVEVQQADVTSPDDVTKRIEAQRAQDRKSVLMLIQGQDGVRYVPLPLTKSGKDTKPG